jgi:transcriptional regulator with XRE-family HTH domain
VDTTHLLLVEARRAAGLNQGELAERAGTSRPTLSAYEHGRKTPTVDTMSRLLAAAGARIELAPLISWRQVPLAHGRVGWVPSALWRLPVTAALAEVVLPLELNWSGSGRTYRLRDRRERSRLYEVVLREGQPADLERYLDGALLVDVWQDLVLPRALRAAWQGVIDSAVGTLPGNAAERTGSTR